MYSCGVRWAARAQRDLDTLLVVPTDVGIQSMRELPNGRCVPVTGVEQPRLQPSEESFQAALSGD